jgi:hypothetical protein
MEGTQKVHPTAKVQLYISTTLKPVYIQLSQMSLCIVALRTRNILVHTGNFRTLKEKENLWLNKTVFQI